MSKLGDAYQEAVADVARILDPNARVDVGVWVTGPDGRRDLDVAVYPFPNNPTPLVLIECKDWGRPVGIAAIEALESKRRDLGVSVAMICSNSGFTADAIRKAARVGIPVLSALVEGDSRIRIEGQEEIFTRRIMVTHSESTWHFLVPNVQEFVPPGTTGRDLVFDDKLVSAWVREKTIWFAGMSTRSRQVIAKYKFKRPIQLHVRDTILPVNGVDLTMDVRVQWCSQIVQIGASSGMYDYLRKRVIFGPGTNQYLLKNVDLDKWAPVDDVPAQLLVPPTPGKKEMLVSLATVTGVDTCDEAPAPDVDSLVDKSEVTETVTET
jgi:hypothetical protein